LWLVSHRNCLLPQFLAMLQNAVIVHVYLPPFICAHA
jgi:hypothetical protein